MRTNAVVNTTVVVHLSGHERFAYTGPSGRELILEQVGYSGGHTSFVGRHVLKGKGWSKRTTLVNNIPPREVPDAIRESIVGAVRASIGEQAKALGLLR